MEDTTSDKIYYENQTGWQKEDYYYLHRVLHRLLCNYDKNSIEIENMDTARMSQATRVLIYCIIKYYHYDFLFDLNESLSDLKNTKPLEETLVLDDKPLPDDNIYKAMNVMY